MSRIRTFIAIDPGKVLRDRLVALQDKLAQSGTEVKWVGPNNLHITLLFLGEVNDTDIPAVCTVVQESVACFPAFSLILEAAGCFPNLRRPRVIWAGVGQGACEVVAIHDALEKPLLQLGCYRREDRQYTPHITLGRVKSDRPTDRLTALLARQAAWKGGETTVREILVMSSELTPVGPEYSVLSRARLNVHR